MAKKYAFVIGYGQSNEVGPGIKPNGVNGVAVLPTVPGPNVRFVPLFGAPAGQAVAGTPGTASTSGMFQMAVDSFAARTGCEILLLNAAKGNTGVVDAWWGRDSTTGELVPQGGAGYDPSGNIAELIKCVTLAASLGYTVIQIHQGHQNDISLNRPVAQVVDASVRIANLCKAAGASKLMVGRTPRYIGGANEAEWNPGGKIHQFADGILAAFPGALRGADCTVSTDINLRAIDTPLPGIHSNHAGVCMDGELWSDVLVDHYKNGRI